MKNEAKARVLKPTWNERLQEAVRERDECSRTCLELIMGFERLIDRFKISLRHPGEAIDEMMAEIGVSKDREIIRKARRGK
jgi:hypothetical protein